MSVVADTTTAAARIVIIGAGPAGIMILERIVAGHAALAASDRPAPRLDITLVDPHEPGGGRIWRRSQSPLLKLNTMLRDAAVFTDASCEIEGPIVPGPSLAEWIEQVLAGRITRPDWWDDTLEREIHTATGEAFPTRRLNSAYLAWAYEEVQRRARPEVKVSWKRDTAVAVQGAEAGVSTDTVADRGEAHTVHLASGAVLETDIVVHAVGHNGSEPGPGSARLASFAHRHGLRYVAPAFTADVDLSWLPAGEPVIVRGMGLAAVDLVVLLTEGRGGRFTRDTSGSLSYTPSGQEPMLHLGSRRGVPYRSKITSQVVGEPVSLEYLDAAFVAQTSQRHGSFDFERDAWPLIAAELLTGYYRELFTGHPHRVTGDWAAFADGLRAVLAVPGGFRSERLFELVRTHVPDPLDRFDLDSFDRPLDTPGARGLGDPPSYSHPTDALQQRVRDHIASDLTLRTSQRHSATQALFLTALYAYFALAEIPAEAWNARSRSVSLPKRWHTYFSYLASGPPGHRLEELLALSQAGVVRFLGADVTLETDDTAGVFRAAGSAVTRDETTAESVTVTASASARVLIDAWLPEATAATSDNPLLQQLVTSGQARELAVADAEHSGTTGQLTVGASGRLPGAGRQFAHGAFTSVASGGAFTRPGMNSLPFRLHDRIAQAVLAEAQEVGHEASGSVRLPVVTTAN